MEGVRGNLSGSMTEGSRSVSAHSCIGTDMTIASGILRRTPLHALHLDLGGKMVPFAGYEMPVQYPAGILKEHLHTREKAGLFDVSHMGQAFLAGDMAALEKVTPADVAGLKDGMQRYGLLLTEAGTIKDDFMFSRLAGEADLYLVVNAATKEGDFAYIGETLKEQATLTLRPDRALLALQGPMAVTVLERHSPGISALTFMKVVRARVAGVPAIVSRTGYTGEDGFEISVEGADAERVARALLGESEVLPIGLGARDSLRLEAGLCLYGHDMDETRNPAEANLLWSIGKRRKEAGDFPGAAETLKSRPGIKPEGRAPAREGTEIAAKDGRIIGKVTSGGFGPSLNAPVAMGYVETAFEAPGTQVDLMVRGKAMPAVISPMPFVPHSYRR